MIGRRININPFLNISLKTILNKILTLISDIILLIGRKVNNRRLQHNSLIKYPHLTEFVSKRFFPKKHFEINDSNRPNINFGCYDCLFLSLETLGRQVPVGADALGRQLDHVLFCCLA